MTNLIQQKIIDLVTPMIIRLKIYLTKTIVKKVFNYSDMQTMPKDTQRENGKGKCLDEKHKTRE